MKGQTLTEFSSELDIPKSTLQSVMIDGNTTVDTLIRMSSALNESLDTPVFGECQTKRISDVMQFINEVSWFVMLSSEKQEKFRYHLNEMLLLLDYEI